MENSWGQSFFFSYTDCWNKYFNTGDIFNYMKSGNTIEPYTGYWVGQSKIPSPILKTSGFTGYCSFYYSIGNLRWKGLSLRSRPEDLGGENPPNLFIHWNIQIQSNINGKVLKIFWTEFYLKLEFDLFFLKFLSLPCNEWVARCQVLRECCWLWPYFLGKWECLQLKRLGGPAALLRFSVYLSKYARSMLKYGTKWYFS